MCPVFRRPRSAAPVTECLFVGADADWDGFMIYLIARRAVGSVLQSSKNRASAASRLQGEQRPEGRGVTRTRHGLQKNQEPKRMRYTVWTLDSAGVSDQRQIPKLMIARIIKDNGLVEKTANQPRAVA